MTDEMAEVRECEDCHEKIVIDPSFPKFCPRCDGDRIQFCGHVPRGAVFLWDDYLDGTLMSVFAREPWRPWRNSSAWVGKPSALLV